MKRYQTSLIRLPREADDKVMHEDGNTRDIINTVLFADKFAAGYTASFAQTLRGKTLFDTCRNIWEFVKTQIRYKVDPVGIQDIKSPGRLWAERVGDCKSFSVFTASCLRNLGIPYGYRFTSYSGDPTPTHVYVYVPTGKGEILMDSVWHGPFNTQKQYTHKQDYLMSKISYLGSLTPPQARRAEALRRRQSMHVPGVLKINKDLADLTEDELDLLLTRQRLEIERANSAAVGGPFNWQLDRYDQAIGVVNQALAAYNRGDAAYFDRMGNHFEANGNAMVGSIFKKIGKGLAKIGKGIAKGAKAVAKVAIKVATFPLRMIAKLILEIYLPKAAGGFLYLFGDEKALPDKMLRKRKKQEKFKNFVTKKIGMKEKHFMGILRNSLTKKLGMSPESYLAKTLNKTAVKGIGDVGYTHRKAQVNLQWMKYGRMRNFRHCNDYIKGLEEHPDSIRENRVIAGLTGIAGIGDTSFADAASFASQGAGAAKKGGFLKKASTTAATLFAGPAGGFIMAAINWIISKLGGKKEGVDMTKEDLPDPVADAGNAFNEDNLKSPGFDSYTPEQMSQVRQLTGNAIEAGYGRERAASYIQENAPFVKREEAAELGQEAEAGWDPITEKEARQAATRIRQERTDPSGQDIEKLERTGGGSGTGICKC